MDPATPTKSMSCSGDFICQPESSIFPAFGQMLKRKFSDCDESDETKKARIQKEYHRTEEDIDAFIMGMLLETVANQREFEELVDYAQQNGSFTSQRFAYSFLRQSITSKQMVWRKLSKLKHDFQSDLVITVELEMRSVERIFKDQLLLLDEGWVLVRKLL